MNLELIIYSEKGPELWGRVRKYDPKADIVEKTKKNVVIKLKKFPENEKPEDPLYVWHS